MKEKSNKKYLIFPIIMLVLAIVTTFLGHHFGSIYETLEKYDITGMATICMYAMLFFEITVLAFCIYKGKKGLEEGFDYLFSKFISFIFILLIIIPIISFFNVRNEEEKLANELENKNKETIENVFLEKNSKNKNKLKGIQDYIDLQENDQFYDRKQEIASEIQGNSKGQYFLRYFIFNRYNYNFSYKNNLTMKERYYAIFSRASLINIICFVFYVTSWITDQRLNKMRTNRRRRN